MNRHSYFKALPHLRYKPHLCEELWPLSLRNHFFENELFLSNLSIPKILTKIKIPLNLYVNKLNISKELTFSSTVLYLFARPPSFSLIAASPNAYDFYVFSLIWHINSDQELLFSPMPCINTAS